MTLKKSLPSSQRYESSAGSGIDSVLEIVQVTSELGPLFC